MIVSSVAQIVHATVFELSGIIAKKAAVNVSKALAIKHGNPCLENSIRGNKIGS